MCFLIVYVNPHVLVKTFQQGLVSLLWLNFLLNYLYSAGALLLSDLTSHANSLPQELCLPPFRCLHGHVSLQLADVSKSAGCTPRLQWQCLPALTGTVCELLGQTLRKRSLCLQRKSVSCTGCFILEPSFVFLHVTDQLEQTSFISSKPEAKDHRAQSCSNCKHLQLL